MLYRTEKEAANRPACYTYYLYESSTYHWDDNKKSKVFQSADEKLSLS